MAQRGANADGEGECASPVLSVEERRREFNRRFDEEITTLRREYPPAPHREQTAESMAALRAGFAQHDRFMLKFRAHLRTQAQRRLQERNGIAWGQ